VDQMNEERHVFRLLLDHGRKGMCGILGAENVFVMGALRTMILIFTAAAALSCCAATNNLESAITSFPRISAWEFRPDEAVLSANTLIEAGKDAACRALETSIKTKREWRFAHTGFDDKLSQDEGESNRKVCHLCRLIFTPTNSGEFLRAPRLGGSSTMPYESLKPPNWPDMPFAIVNGVPYSMTFGYALQGMPERAESYLAYCQTNGNFRTKTFPKPTFLTASNALNQLFGSAAWKALKWKDQGLGWSYTFDEDYAKTGLRKQIENMANQTVRHTAANPSAQETSQSSSSTGP